MVRPEGLEPTTLVSDIPPDTNATPKDSLHLEEGFAGWLGGVRLAVISLLRFDHFLYKIRICQDEYADCLHGSSHQKSHSHFFNTCPRICRRTQ